MNIDYNESVFSLYVNVTPSQSLCFTMDDIKSSYDENEFSSYTMHVNIYDDEYDRPVAYMEAILIDYLEAAKNDGFDLIADEAINIPNSEACEAFSAIPYGVEYEYYGHHDFSGYIHVLYVYPEYRHIGISSFILNNLSNILYDTYGYNLLYMTIIPVIVNTDITDDNRVRLNGPVEKDKYTNEQKYLLRIMKDNLNKNEYINVDGNVYMRKYI